MLILVMFYIKPQLETIVGLIFICCILFYFYIKPQQINREVTSCACCILFYFYIKPQLVLKTVDGEDGCILFYFYIKPQPQGGDNKMRLCCILFYFYIKPQLFVYTHEKRSVVSYSISTSNHNFDDITLFDIQVVSYSISTSNHNVTSRDILTHLLYLILFLHQTTTELSCSENINELYLILFLHQTTTPLFTTFAEVGCILFYFYIKPQHQHLLCSRD